MAGRTVGHRRLLRRLQSAFESRSTAPAASAFTCTGEAFLRSSATASTSAPDIDSSSARSWSQSHPGCTVSRSFVSSAILRADPVPPISPKLRAKKEYRQQERQQQRSPAPPRSTPIVPPPVAGARNAPAERIEEEEEEGELMTTDKKLINLKERDILQYVPLPPESLPEAFPEHSQSPAIAMLPKSGCKGLQDEFEATRQDYVMYRPYIHALLSAIKGKKMKQLLLDGMPGAGKSIAVATMAVWARQAGWVVLYVPNAEVLTDGGFYSYNESAGAWDTPQSAQYILQYLLTSHKDALEAMKTRDGARSLAAVASEGIESPKHSVPVDAALAVLEGLEAQSEVPVLIAVDRYNALHTNSEYGQTVNDNSRRLIPASQLRLARAMRILEREPPANGVHVAAPARHDRISQRVPVTLGADCAVVGIPRFVPEEWKNALDWYDATMVLCQEDVNAMQSFMMCQGNARELRQAGESVTFQFSTVQYHDRR